MYTKNECGETEKASSDGSNNEEANPAKTLEMEPGRAKTPEKLPINAENLTHDRYIEVDISESNAASPVVSTCKSTRIDTNNSSLSFPNFEISVMG